MADNLFLKNKNPSTWDLKSALNTLEKKNPSLPLFTQIRNLKSSLEYAKKNGNGLQQEEAKRLLKNWMQRKKMLYSSSNSNEVEEQERSTNAGSNSPHVIHSDQIVIIKGDVNGDIVVQNHDQNNSSSQGSSQGTWYSRDAHPLRQKAHNYISSAYDHGNYIVCERYSFENINMSHECAQYRRISMAGAENRAGLRDARIMSLSYVFLLSNSIRSMLSPIQNNGSIFVTLKRNDQLTRRDKEYGNVCKSLSDLIDADADEEELLGLVNGSNLMIEEVSILRHLIERLSHWNENELDLKEEDLIKEKLQYLIDPTIGRIKDASSSWSTYTMEPDERISNQEFYYPDYVLYNSKLSSMVKFELFVVEVKKMRPSINKYESDLVRLGKQLKIMIDKFVLHGVADPVAVGMLVQGIEAKLYKMVLAGPGCYLMLEIQTIHLLRSPHDLPLIPSLLERFDQAKALVQESLQKLYTAYRKYPNGTGHNSLLQKGWLRRACTGPMIDERDKPNKRRKSRR